MPNTKSYASLHDRVMAREGAVERLSALRDDTLREIALHELRAAAGQSQSTLAATLGISQPAVSQIERGEDIKLSTLRSYVGGLGARLDITAVFGDPDHEIAIPIAFEGVQTSE